MDVMTFGLTADQYVRAQEFYREHLQKLELSFAGAPYEGAIGGGLTYEFTPTSLGVIVDVVFAKGTKHEAKLMLTDFEEW